MSDQTPAQALCWVAYYATREDGESFAQLVKDVSIKRHGADLTPQALAAALRTNPDLIESWLVWSMNKRVSSGWYFQRDPDGCVVGYYPNGPRLHYDDLASGCAEFIAREVGLTHAL